MNIESPSDQRQLDPTKIVGFMLEEVIKRLGEAWKVDSQLLYRALIKDFEAGMFDPPGPTICVISSAKEDTIDEKEQLQGQDDVSVCWMIREPDLDFLPGRRDTITIMDSHRYGRWQTTSITHTSGLPFDLNAIHTPSVSFDPNTVFVSSGAIKKFCSARGQRVPASLITREKSPTWALSMDEIYDILVEIGAADEYHRDDLAAEVTERARKNAVGANSVSDIIPTRRAYLAALKKAQANGVIRVAKPGRRKR